MSHYRRGQNCGHWREVHQKLLSQDMETHVSLNLWSNCDVIQWTCMRTWFGGKGDKFYFGTQKNGEESRKWQYAYSYHPTIHLTQQSFLRHDRRHTIRDAYAKVHNLQGNWLDKVRQNALWKIMKTQDSCLGSTESHTLLGLSAKKARRAMILRRLIGIGLEISWEAWISPVKALLCFSK